MLCCVAPNVKVAQKYSYMYMEKYLEKYLSIAYGKIYECLLKYWEQYKI